MGTHSDQQINHTLARTPEWCVPVEDAFREWDLSDIVMGNIAHANDSCYTYACRIEEVSGTHTNTHTHAHTHTHLQNLHMRSWIMQSAPVNNVIKSHDVAECHSVTQRMQTKKYGWCGYLKKSLMSCSTARYGRPDVNSDVINMLHSGASSSQSHSQMSVHTHTYTSMNFTDTCTIKMHEYLATSKLCSSAQRFSQLPTSTSRNPLPKKKSFDSDRERKPSTIQELFAA